jgi:peptide/nickel transport system ATP-binding protein
MLTPQPTAGQRRRPLLAVRGLSTHISSPRGPVHGVDAVSYTVRAGESLGIVGESGSGKSMLCRSVMGLAPAHARTWGRADFDGIDLLSAGPRRLRRIRGAEVAMVLQNPTAALNPVLRVGRQITETLRAHCDHSRKEAREKAVDLLRQVGVPAPEQRVRSYPHQLSGGMRQRVCIAIAVAASPRLLFADEPTTALDVTIQRQVLDLLASLRARHGMATVLVSHDLSLVAGRTDRVLVMYGGRVVESGPTRRLFAAARHPYTAALLASVPRLDAPSHERLTEIPGHPVDVVAPAPGCRFAARCPRATRRCLREDPVLTPQADPGHEVACFHPVSGPDAEGA